MTKISKIIASAGTLGVLGIAALPVVGYAASPDSKDVVVNVEVGQAFSLACSLPNNQVNFTGGANAADTTTMAGTCTVSSNNVGGYTLVAKSTQAGTGAANLIDGAKTITSAAGVPTGGTASWAINTRTGQTAPGTGGTAAAWLAVPQSGGTAIGIADTTAVSGASGDQYSYTFGAAIAANTPNGSYSDTVRFTATAK